MRSIDKSLIREDIQRTMFNQSWIPRRYSIGALKTASIFTVHRGRLLAVVPTTRPAGPTARVSLHLLESTEYSRFR